MTPLNYESVNDGNSLHSSAHEEPVHERDPNYLTRIMGFQGVLADTMMKNYGFGSNSSGL